MEKTPCGTLILKTLVVQSPTLSNSVSLVETDKKKEKVN